MKSKIGFYINHGLEVRYYLLSGLLDLCRKDYEVCFYTNSINSKVLIDYTLKYKVEVKVLPIHKIPKPKFEAYLRSFTNARKRANNVEIYNHFGALPPKRFYDFLLKVPLLSLMGNYFFRKLSLWYYKNEELLSFFKTEKLARLYQLQYDSILLKIVGVNASLSGAKVDVFINTLKTVFIDDFIVFKINRLYSWSIIQNKLFQQANKGINESVFLPLGSPYHNFLRNKDDKAQQKMITKYNLDITRPIVIYSLINEKVYKNEHLIIELICNYFNDNFENHNRPQIVIRRNPFEQDSEHINYLKSLPCTIVADHFWERNEKEEWSIQAEEGEVEWRALLQLASVSMNIPSMATIDSLMCGTPVVNLNFNHLGEFNNELSFIIESPYSKYFEGSKFVFSINNINELNSLTDDYLFTKSNNNSNNILQSLDISKSTLEKFL
jgi:hypothetical protein